MVGRRRSTGASVAGTGTRALRVLARREVSEAGLRAALGRAGLDQATVEAELEAARALGVLDDARSVEVRTRRLVEGRALGQAGMRRRLLESGYPPELVETALQDAIAETQWNERSVAEELVRVRAVPADARGQARLARLLLSRGFDSELVEDLLWKGGGPSG
jgi:SOS response regulatory protein OraA/RecX